MGPPGAGKGTVCEGLVKDYNYRFLSAGDLLRKEKSSGSSLGNKIAEIIDKGNLVPDEMISNIMLNQFRKSIPLGISYLIDGYPRTIKQAFQLDTMINIQLVIWLDVSDETTIKRNLKRGETSGRPDDANEGIIRKRIGNYKKQSLPLKDYYFDKIVEIDGEGTPQDVYKRIVDTLFEKKMEMKDISDILE